LKGVVERRRVTMETDIIVLVSKTKKDINPKEIPKFPIWKASILFKKSPEKPMIKQRGRERRILKMNSVQGISDSPATIIGKTAIYNETERLYLLKEAMRTIYMKKTKIFEKGLRK
jgi:hypothetical protein